MHKCVSAMHKYTSHTHTLLQCRDIQAWLDIWSCLLSWNTAQIVPGSFVRENQLENEENHVLEAVSFPQVYFESSSHSISTSLFMDLIIWSQCTSVNKKFGWVTSKIKSRKNLSKREKMGEVVLQNFRAGSDLTNIHMLVVLPWAN